MLVEFQVKAANIFLEYVEIVIKNVAFRNTSVVKGTLILASDFLIHDVA